MVTIERNLQLEPDTRNRALIASSVLHRSKVLGLWQLLVAAAGCIATVLEIIYKERQNVM